MHSATRALAVKLKFPPVNPAVNSPSVWVSQIGEDSQYGATVLLPAVFHGHSHLRTLWRMDLLGASEAVIKCLSADSPFPFDGQAYPAAHMA